MEYSSRIVGNAGLTTGIIGTALGVANSGLLPGLFGGANCNAVCHENMPVSRYDAQKDAEIAALKSQVALRDANAFTDQKFADLNDRYNDRFRNIEAELARNAVKQQAVDDSIMLVNERLECCKTNIMERLCREIDDRKCGDNTIITYANATFYPKQVADVTVGTTTTPQTVYNPLPIQCCGRCGG